MLILLLAVIVAGATAFLARAWLQNERQALIDQAGQHRVVPQAPALKVLVAKRDIRIGQLIKPDQLQWQPWPAGDLPASYVIEGKRKLEDFVGGVVRATIAGGEPITEVKVVTANSRGFMAAVLQPGRRAVSIPVTATTSVSGFIYAGDRVDVLLTHALSANEGKDQHNATETILRNARVIAIDQQLSDSLDVISLLMDGTGDGFTSGSCTDRRPRTDFANELQQALAQIDHDAIQFRIVFNAKHGRSEFVFTALLYRVREFLASSTAILFRLQK